MLMTDYKVSTSNCEMVATYDDDDVWSHHGINVHEIFPNVSHNFN